MIDKQSMYNSFIPINSLNEDIQCEETSKCFKEKDELIMLMLTC